MYRREYLFNSRACLRAIREICGCLPGWERDRFQPFGTLLIAGLLTTVHPPVLAAQTATVLRVESGVDEVGGATDQWLAMLRKRLAAGPYDSVAPLKKPLTTEESAWAQLIQSRISSWEKEIPPLAQDFRPVAPPARVRIVTGNRGAEDAFTHDPTTIGFDLAALQANYGDATLEVNQVRMDRFFRHEFVHLLQKAWLVEYPWTSRTPIGAALIDIWTEGQGNYYSLSERWQTRNGNRSAAAAGALAELEPRFVARMAALACATPEAGKALMADLSWGRFDQKWGALTAALWLEMDQATSPDAMRRFIRAGPDGVWELAARHLSPALARALTEARAAESLC